VFGPDTASTISKNRTGWTVGGGVEYAVDYNWSVFGEYRYTDFGHLTNLPASVGSFSERHHDTENAVRLGVNYRF
jgi:opacity protein-like surface antigen